MDDSNHTPGPWELFPSGNRAWWHVGPKYRMDDIPSRRTTFLEADARLIAVAPEMHRLLRRVVDIEMNRSPSAMTAIERDVRALLKRIDGGVDKAREGK